MRRPGCGVSGQHGDGWGSPVAHTQTIDDHCSGSLNYTHYSTYWIQQADRHCTARHTLLREELHVAAGLVKELVFHQKMGVSTTK